MIKLIASFVMTIDGKVQGPGEGYWPVGSAADQDALLDLRARCDVLIHGRLTALGHEHIKHLTSPEFQHRLRARGRHMPFVYVVISSHPDEMLLRHIDPAGAPVRVIVVTTDGSEVPAEVPAGIEIWRCGPDMVDLKALNQRLEAQGWTTGALEAGPRLFGAYVAAGLVDELIVTVAPKMFGTAFGTPTMINGVLFRPDRVPQWELADHRIMGDEIRLHYRLKRAKS